MYDAESGKPAATSVQEIDNYVGPCLQPGRHAHRDRRRRWPDATLGHDHRHDDRPMSRAHTQGVERGVSPGWSSPCDEPRPIVPYANGIPRRAGGRAALRSSHRGSPDGEVQLRRGVDRLRRHGPDCSGVGRGEPPGPAASCRATSVTSAIWHSRRTAAGWLQ